MEELFKNGWEKLWPLLNKFFDLIVLAWQKISPYLSNAWNFFEIIYFQMKKLLAGLFLLLLQLYDREVPVVMEFAKSKPYVAGLLFACFTFALFFWIKIFKHAHKNEVAWAKLWLLVIIFLGPLGSLIYFLARIKYLEYESRKHDKVMMSFFSPMHQGSRKRD